MASCLARHIICIQSPQTSSCAKCEVLNRYPCCAAQIRSLPKLSSRKNHGPSLKTPPGEPKETSSPKRIRSPKTDISSRSSFLGPSSSLRWLRDGVFKFDPLVLDILTIAFPAALALAADPITSLVDTAFVGHLGSVELAAVGVSISVFNLVSKLFNVPLLNITTSFVAEENALISKNNDCPTMLQGKKKLPSVTTSLALATGLGVAEAVALFFGSGHLMNIMGIPADSPMREPAEYFLSLRAIGAPAIVLSLAAQGTFRGFKDTKAPLYAIVAGNLLNAILDSIFIFPLHFGIGGAAVATVISEYLIAFVLLWKLNENLSFTPSNFDLRRIAYYLRSGGLLIGRTLSVLVTMTLATSMAARLGPTSMAGYQICIQVWLTISLLTDALALAGQALLASDYSQGNYEQSRQVIYSVLQIGSVTGIALAFILFLGFGAFSILFTTDSEVLEITWSGLLFVAGSQPVNALAFVIDGLYYGVSDFGYAAYSMVVVSMVSSVFLLVVAPAFGLTGIYSGLFLFMTLRVVAGVWRLGSKSGPWKMVWHEAKQKGY